MKRKFHLISTFIVAIPVLTLLLALGCKKTLDPAGVYKGDAVLYQADLTIVTAYDVLHGFVLWEYNNHALLGGTPEVTAAANNIRANAAKWLASASACREAYAANPTSQTRSALTSALLVLQTAMNEAIKYLAPPATTANTNTTFLIEPETPIKRK